MKFTPPDIWKTPKLKSDVKDFVGGYFVVIYSACVKNLPNWIFELVEDYEKFSEWEILKKSTYDLGRDELILTLRSIYDLYTVDLEGTDFNIGYITEKEPVAKNLYELAKKTASKLENSRQFFDRIFDFATEITIILGKETGLGEISNWSCKYVP